MRMFNSHTSPRYVFERRTAPIHPQVRRNILAKLQRRNDLCQLPILSKERGERNTRRLVVWTVAVFIGGALMGWLFRAHL